MVATILVIFFLGVISPNFMHFKQTVKATCCSDSKSFWSFLTAVLNNKDT